MSSDIHLIPLRDRLTVRLTSGVILVLLLIGVPFFFAFRHLLRSEQVGALTEASAGMSRVMVDALRSSMLAGQPHLLDEAVRDLARQKDIERVLLLNHEGDVKVTSDPAFEGRNIDRESEGTCKVCHVRPGHAPASRAVVASDRGRRVFRAMSAIPNDPDCHACHDPSAPNNGILLMDLAVDASDRRYLAGMGGMVGLATVMALLTVGVLVLLLRQMVHKPLDAVVNVSQRVAAGDLGARVPVAASGEFGVLADRVNRMTDHLANSIQTVDAHRRELQSILDSVDDEIVVLDRDLRVVAVNEAFVARSGSRSAELTGRTCREVATGGWPCASDQPGGCPIEKVFETGQLHKGIVSRVGSDGEERVLEIHASPVRGAEGEIRHAVEVRRDISERRQLQASIAHSERLASLGLLASGISHEINNPLGAISASVEGLRRRLPEVGGLSDEARGSLASALELIGKEVDRGREITHRLLRVARPERLSRSFVDPNRVVEDIVAILGHDIRRTGVRADLDLGTGLPPLLGDESRLSQVVMNVTLNAIQAMEARGGLLRITTRPEEGGVRITVDDEGCGISPEYLGKIYEPFFTTKPVGKGTGLGLFITHRIVSEMGGSVSVRSQAGKGTSLTLWLPCTERSEAA